MINYLLCYCYLKKGNYLNNTDQNKVTLFISKSIDIVKNVKNIENKKEIIDSYLEIEYNIISKNLILKNDKFASIPVYYSNKSDIIIASDGLVNFVKIEKCTFSINLAQALLFLMFGYSFQHQSLLDSILSLPYASELDIDKQVIKSYWQFPHESVTTNLEYENNKKRKLPSF